MAHLTLRFVRRKGWAPGVCHYLTDGLGENPERCIPSL